MRREPAFVLDDVDDPKRTLTHICFVTPAQRQVLAVGDVLPDDALRPEGASVAVPLLAVRETTCRRQGDPIVCPVLSGEPLGESVLSRVDRLGSANGDEAGGIEQAAEPDPQPGGRVEIALVIPGPGEKLGGSQQSPAP